MRRSERTALVVLWGFVGSLLTVLPAVGGPGPAGNAEVAPLVAKLKSDKWSQRQTAALKLGRLKSPDAAPALLRALKQECSLTDAALRRRAWGRAPEELDKQTAREGPAESSFAQVSHALKRAYLSSIVDIGPQVEQRVRAERRNAKPPYAACLDIIRGSWGRKDTFDSLVRLVREDKDGYIRAAAARALGHVGNRDAIPVLKAARVALKQLGVKDY